MMTRTSRISRVSLVVAASVALIGLTGCGASDTAEETCERLDGYIDDMQDFIPAAQEDDPEGMSTALDDLAGQIQEIRDDAGDEELASALDAVIDTYELLHEEFDGADEDQSGDEIRNAALSKIDFDALAEAGETLDSTCDLG